MSQSPAHAPQTPGVAVLAPPGSITYRPTQSSSTIPIVFVVMGVLFAGAGLLFTIILVLVFPPVAV